MLGFYRMEKTTVERARIKPVSSREENLLHGVAPLVGVGHLAWILCWWIALLHSLANIVKHSPVLAKNASTERPSSSLWAADLRGGEAQILPLFTQTSQLPCPHFVMQFAQPERRSAYL